MRLIVNADDCGYSPGINRGIIHAFCRGIVTSTTLMVNQQYCGDAVALLKRHNILSAGLHLNLTRGRPLSEPRCVSTLVDETGCFHTLDLIYSLPIAAAEVETELEAQFWMMVQLGLFPTHLDAHHHLQCHPVIREVMITVAARYKLPLRHFQKEDKDAMLRAGITTPDFFISSFWDEQANVEYLCKTLRLLSSSNSGKSVVELMTHPGFSDENACGSSYYQQRQQELSVLCSSEVKELIDSLKIELVDYRSLRTARSSSQE